MFCSANKMCASMQKFNNRNKMLSFSFSVISVEREDFLRRIPLSFLIITYVVYMKLLDLLCTLEDMYKPVHDSEPCSTHW